MSDFNYTEYLKNNPLFKKEEVKGQLITESQEIQNEEVAEVEETVTEEFSEFKSYTDIISTLESRFTALEKYLEENQPELVKLAKTFKDTLDELNKKIGDADAKASSVTEEEIELSQDEMDDLHKDGEIEKGEDTISYKIKVSELKAKIKEDIIELLSEEEEEDVEAEIEDEVEVEDEIDMEEPEMGDPTPSEVGLSAEEQAIQDDLKSAYDNAVAIGDEKLADQIGNSITFFTRSHVVER